MGRVMTLTKAGNIGRKIWDGMFSFGHDKFKVPVQFPR